MASAQVVQDEQGDLERLYCVLYRFIKNIRYCAILKALNKYKRTYLRVDLSAP